MLILGVKLYALILRSRAALHYDAGVHQPHPCVPYMRPPWPPPPARPPPDAQRRLPGTGCLNKTVA